MLQLQFRAMGCQMLAQLEADETPAAQAALAEVPAWFAEWERTLSRFQFDSELMRLNRSGGAPVTVSPVLWEVLQAALAAEAESQGLVTPTLLAELEAAGYDRSFTELAVPAPAGLLPSAPAAFEPALQLALAERSADVVLDPAARTVQLRDGVQLDLGGVAKGWAAEQAAGRLSAWGPALVEAGGDIAISGPRRDGSAWLVAVADPQWPDANLAVLQVPAGGVATSGRDYRRWQHGGVWQHHILDPRTGRPAVTDVLSATVVAPTLRAAEIAAKAALILGSLAGRDWIETRPPLAALLVLDDGGVWPSARLADYLAGARHP